MSFLATLSPYAVKQMADGSASRMPAAGCVPSSFGESLLEPTGVPQWSVHDQASGSDDGLGFIGTLEEDGHAMLHSSG